MTFFNQQGFTLIELIIVIVVLGVLVGAGSFGLRQSIDGYNLAMANAESTQKAQLALDRITLELSHINYNDSLAKYSISAGTNNRLTYTANFGGSDELHTIDQNGSIVRMDTDNTKPLTDNADINGLQFTYFDGYGNAIGATSPDMRIIGIALRVQVISGVTRTYNTRVALP